MITAQEKEPQTEKTLAIVEIDGDEEGETLTVATLLRSDGRFWVERLLGKRSPHGTLPSAMSELDRVALAYNGRVKNR